MRTKFSKLLSILLCLVMVVGLLPTVVLAAEGDPVAQYTGIGTYATAVSEVKSAENAFVSVSGNIYRDGTKLSNSKIDNETYSITAIQYRDSGSSNEYSNVPEAWVSNKSDKYGSFYFVISQIPVGSYDIQITFDFTGTYNNGTKDTSDDENISVTGMAANTTLDVLPDVAVSSDPFVLEVSDVTASYADIGQTYLPIPFKAMCGTYDVSGVVEVRWELVEGVTMSDSDPDKQSDGSYTFGHLYPFANGICGTVQLKVWAVYGHYNYDQSYELIVDKTTKPATINVTMTDCDKMFAAQIGSTGYTTLAAAITAANSGDTVTLLKDVDLGSNTLTINKKITLDGGAEKHSITSTVGGAVVDINTSERVTIQNLKIFATASGKTGRGIGISNTSAKIDVNNVEIETTQRGITVNTDTNNGIELNLESCLISLVEPSQHASEYNYDTTVLPTNNYNDSRGISLWDMANSTVTLKDTTVRGFYYSINNSGNDPATGSNGLVVSAEDCTFKGRAAVNQHNAGVIYTLTNCDITGINNYSGSQEGFACIVLNPNASDNSIAVNGGTVRASFNDTGSSNTNATQFLVDDRAGSNTVTLNNVTYTCPTEYGNDKGGIVGEIRPGTEITVESGSYTMPEIIDTSYRNEAGEIGTLNILGGNFAYNTVSASIEDPDVQNALNISGGTFSSDPTDYVTDGKIAKKNSETEYAVMAKSGLTSGVYMSDPTDYTAANHYVTKNNDGTWTVFYVAPYVAPTYSITVDSAKHGDVTVSPRNASKGATVTITVESDKGYTLETLTVTDKDGDEIELTNKGDGKYTFTMPAGKVYVEATFMEDNSMLNFFVDVFPGDYYYDAVLWAVKNGITGGVDAAHFAPNATCTRAQVVTFLWRAAGSPAPKSSMMPFTDVPAGSYYETAVLWAAENGITGGTGNNAFSPDATCSRGQIVSFLWRALGFPTVSGSANPFADVAADAYYNTAVLWAAENGITGGTGNNAFSPDADCTRAQIVTFLWRALAE